MIALKLVMTTAGLGRFTAAQVDDDIDLTIATVGLSNAAFVAAPTLTALPGEFRRITSVSGALAGDDIVHLVVQDYEPVSYQVRGFGLFLADGTLFASYSQSTPIAEKATGAMLALAIDIAFPLAGIDKLTFGDTNFLLPPATTDGKGVVELATLAEGEAGDAARVTTGAVVKAMLSAAIDAVSEAIDGLIARTIYGTGLVKGGGTLGSNITLTVDAATSDDVRAGTRPDVAITPAALAGAGSVVLLPEGRRVSPDGFVEIWGISPTRATEGPLTIVFATPFPSACLGIHAMTINTNQTDNGLTSLQEVALHADRAELYAQNHNADIKEVGGFRWRAWGF